MTAATEPETPETDVKMTIWDHLAEFRRRLIKSALAVGLCMGAGWGFRLRIFQWLRVPYEHAWTNSHLPGLPEIQTLSAPDIFAGYLEIALLAGIVGAAPVVLYQLWAFISPGLYHREKRFVIPFVFFSSSLFFSGVCFAHYVVLPFAYNYFFSLLSQAGDSGTTLVTSRPTFEYFLDFTTRVHIVCGVVFELPLFISFLSIAGVVTPMQLLKFSRWAVLLGFIIGAIVTPGGDVTFQFIVSGAILALYFLSVLISFVVARPKKKPADETKKP